MLSRAEIHNFRCLTNVDLTFEPLTILVGPNASGKSTVFDALTPGTERSENAWQGKRHEPPRILFTFERGPRDLKSNRPIQMQPLHLDVNRLRMPNQLLEERLLATDGGNLANTFGTLTRDQQGELAAVFAKLVPMYADIVTRPGPNNGHHRLVFQDRWDASRWYEPGEISDGSVLLLAFLVLQFQPKGPDLIAIEEPERGLHPYLIGELVATLRKLATGQLGPKPIQVILATHSAELLEFAEPREVRFLSRKETDGTTQVELAPTDSADWAKAFQEYRNSLGGIWLSGAVGGVPGG